MAQPTKLEMESLLPVSLAPVWLKLAPFRYMCCPAMHDAARALASILEACGSDQCSGYSQVLLQR